MRTFDYETQTWVEGDEAKKVQAARRAKDTAWWGTLNHDARLGFYRMVGHLDSEITPAMLADDAPGTWE